MGPYKAFDLKGLGFDKVENHRSKTKSAMW